jgi:lipopolysaccharide export system protein LptA
MSPQKREEPVRITSATLEVRDKSKMATFKGEVQVTQGETEVRCDELVVFYDDEKEKGKEKSGKKKVASSEPSQPGQQQIRRMEARGNVIVSQKDQRAVGDRAEFDMRSNTVTLIGNVIITNAENVVRGTRMVVDLTTGIARMGETGGGTRVEGIFNSKAAPKPGKQN